jgi:hypothetical protein
LRWRLGCRRSVRVEKGRTADCQNGNTDTSCAQYGGQEGRKFLIHIASELVFMISSIQTQDYGQMKQGGPIRGRMSSSDHLLMLK